MITARAFRRLALSLPESVEAPHFDRVSFRVSGKIFATLTRDGSQAMVRVPDMQRVERLLSKHSDAFFSHGTWTTRNGAVGVRLAKVSERLVRELVADAWKHVAPKKLSAPSGAMSARRRATVRAPR